MLESLIVLEMAGSGQVMWMVMLTLGLALGGLAAITQITACAKSR
jgi:hypothetical protein